MRRLLIVSTMLASAGIAQVPAGNSAPQPVPFVDTIPDPQDQPYPGVLKVDVDATDTERGIFRVKETIPVAKTGDVALLFPKWLPGNHAPRGEIEKLAGLVVRSGGRVLPWTRDPVDVFAFHVDVPAGAKALDIEFQFLSATKPDQGRVVATPTMISLQPNSVSLYPAGYFTRQIPVQMTVKFPAGWTAAGAIPSRASQAAGGSTYAYQQVNYQVLVDSPILAGRYGKTWPLSPRVNLNVFADDPKELAATPEQIAAHQRLVDQAVKLFGAQHYDKYEFLLSITDNLGGIGLEHHRSSENGVNPGYFIDWENSVTRRNLLPHEFTHSWDGKFRRGADLWTPDFRTPMRDSLLWVYEGQTQFWGYVLQARSGIVSKQDTLDALAMTAAYYQNTPAKGWRAVVDTTNDPTIAQRGAKAWTSYQWSEDYYEAGKLVWLEADQLIREKTAGRKSLDDFARAFFGMRDRDWGVLTYRFEDVVQTLNGVMPYDWATFLRTRIYAPNPKAPLDWISRGGYRLVYTDKATAYWKAYDTERKTTNLNYSIGLTMGKDGAIAQVFWGGPAFQAGVTNGSKLIAVNGRDYSKDGLLAAITSAKGTNQPIQLLIEQNDQFRTVDVKWNGGLRYPHLDKVGKGEGGLDRLLAPKA